MLLFYGSKDFLWFIKNDKLCFESQCLWWMKYWESKEKIRDPKGRLSPNVNGGLLSHDCNTTHGNTFPLCSLCSVPNKSLPRCWKEKWPFKTESENCQFHGFLQRQTIYPDTSVLISYLSLKICWIYSVIYCMVTKFPNAELRKGSRDFLSSFFQWKWY